MPLPCLCNFDVFVSSQCGSELLSSVDNFAVLQLDVVWCYQALEALGCLQDGRTRLQRAEEAFHRCYGERRQRLLRIQVEGRTHHNTPMKNDRKVF